MKQKAVDDHSDLMKHYDAMADLTINPVTLLMNAIYLSLYFF